MELGELCACTELGGGAIYRRRRDFYIRDRGLDYGC
jgi:hypothetical protein